MHGILAHYDTLETPQRKRRNVCAGQGQRGALLSVAHELALAGARVSLERGVHGCFVLVKEGNRLMIEERQDLGERPGCQASAPGAFEPY
jgi:hypothetical protein